MKNQSSLCTVDTLLGVRMNSVNAGGWHSAAVSGMDGWFSDLPL